MSSSLGGVSYFLRVIGYIACFFFYHNCSSLSSPNFLYNILFSSSFVVALYHLKVRKTGELAEGGGKEVASYQQKGKSFIECRIASGIGEELAFLAKRDSRASLTRMLPY